MEKIGIIGSGTWGTAIAVLLRNNGHEVTLWSAIPAEIEEMAKTRTHKNLPGVTLPEGIIYTADLEEAMKDKNLLVMAVPSVFVRSTAQKMKPFCKEGQLIVDVAKGIEENTLDTMTQIIKEELPMAETAVLSGPSHAEEVSRGLPTLCVAGSRKKNVAEYVQSTFISPVFRVYTSPDVLGIETGAALKNVVALAAGIADGLGYGDNAKAALITRGMAEIARLGIAMGGKYQTYTGLSGIGDLIVTCASMHSRNRRAGAGAKILGAFEVGDNCQIASNAVLLKPLEENSTAAGIPARQVKKDGVPVKDPSKKINTEHICKMQETIDELERRVKELEKELEKAKEEL